jgi:glycosyltransferase involved in cell wall biosynthesis
MYARFVRRASHLVTGTQVGAQQLTFHIQVPPERASVLPQPAPLARDFADAAPSKEISELAQQKFFLYPAQFWPHKNHVNLLHALKLLGGDAKLVLPGSDKGNLAHVRKTVSTLGLEARVLFPGFVSPADLAWLYRHALALVYPSFLGPDNLPPLEAFALGCPVAIADYAGAAEQTGDAALRFNPADPARIADAMGRISDDAALRTSLIERGRERAARWTARDYVRGVFAILDRFETVRRCWP